MTGCCQSKQNQAEGQVRSENGMAQLRHPVLYPLCVELIQRPDPGILVFTIPVSRILVSHKTKGTVHALFAVIEKPALTRSIQIQREVVVLHDKNELVRGAIIQIERI
jgi:hypothetical protein